MCGDPGTEDLALLGKQKVDGSIPSGSILMRFRLDDAARDHMDVKRFAQLGERAWSI